MSSFLHLLTSILNFHRGAANKVTVNIEGNTQIYGNVFGGGDKGEVQGSAEVNIKNED